MMKKYEIFEVVNRTNQMTIMGKNFADACKKANIKPNKYKVVSWAYC